MASSDIPAVDPSVWWDVLDRSVQNQPAKESQPANKDDESIPFWKTFRFRLFFWVCDTVALILWTYVFLKVFAVDVDRTIVDATVPSATWLLGYKLLVELLLVCVIAIFFWRLETLAAMLYIALWPLAIVVWKIPSFVVRRRSWLLFMAAVNTVCLTVRDFRYQLVTKSLGVIAAFLILATNSRTILVPSLLYLVALLVWSTVRVIGDTFRPSWFLTLQKSFIQQLTDSKIAGSTTTLDPAILDKQNDGVLPASELNALLLKIQAGAILTRSLYFWAYRLDQYRQSRLSLVFNVAAYVWQFLGLLLVLSLVNIAVLKIDAGQYGFTDYPSKLAMVWYSLTSLALNDGGGVSPQGDVAYAIRILGALYGLMFIGAFFSNFVLTVIRERDDSALKHTVRELRVLGKQQEARFHSQVDASVDEAWARLRRLGQEGLMVILKFLTPPPEFLKDDDSS